MPGFISGMPVFEDFGVWGTKGRADRIRTAGSWVEGAKLTVTGSPCLLPPFCVPSTCDLPLIRRRERNHCP
ncbi:hypothetical protein GCM10010306_056510 [Streptomyces umbrinus]|nr:hypothetical protein GCM10010306_056510 [Streptomyces umbrinus]